MTDNEFKFVEFLKTGCLKKADFIEILDEDKVKICLNCLSNIINNLLFKPEPIVDEIAKDSFSSGYFYEICVYWVSYLYLCYKNRNYDLRNEKAIEISKILVEKTNISSDFYLDKVLDIEDFKYEEFLPERIVYHMSIEHRSIQQAFSKMVFYFLANKTYPSLREEISNLIKDKILLENFWNLPLI